MLPSELPIPAHFDPDRVDKVWKVAYEQRAAEARQWARRHSLSPADDDSFTLGVLGIDIQNTFCLPDFELYVAGRSGTGAVDDNRRLCRFIYKNLGRITHFVSTLDTHQAIQIFHSIFLVDDQGEHPAPHTQITYQEVTEGRWRFNEKVSSSLGIDPSYGQQHLEHYTKALETNSKFALTVWPFHAMLGSIGHALVPAVEEAIFFHSVARYSQPDFHIKGRHPLTEAYSALGPEVKTGPGGEHLTEKTDRLFQQVQAHDAVVVAGQAKSHCVNWTVADLLEKIQTEDPGLANKLYLLEDCTSPVVVPDAVDYTKAADNAFQRFKAAGAHLVKSTDPIESWPGIAAAS